MELELIVVIGLIIFFIACFCSFLQKVRRHYDGERGRRRTVRVSEIVISRPGYVNSGSVFEESSGVHPSNISPPPYSPCGHYMCPPPKYDEVVKSSKNDLPHVHIPTVSTISGSSVTTGNVMG